MADESISIQVADKVAPSIATKLEGIENRARSAHTSIERLSQALASIQPKGLARLEAAVSKGQRELDRAALSAQRLATEQQRTAGAAAVASTAQQRLAAATAKTGAAQAALATATARTTTEQARGAQAAQRVATEQARTATATSQAGAAADRAALASLRLQQAQNRVADASKRSASGLMSFVRSAAALTGLGLGAGAILGAADAYTVLQNKLQNVSETMAQNNRLTREVFELANKTRTPVQELATAFARFDAALQQTGTSQKESLRITETVTKALKVGGATAGETGSALLQLSQAFNKGKLNGDEFRSLMENMPVFVKKAIAEAAKVPLSGIFDAAAKGKITIDTLREAFEKLGPTVDEKFAKTIPTLSEALTVFKNKFTQAWGEINKSLGVTATLSGLIIGLANNLDVLGVAVTAIGGLMLLYFGPNLINTFKAAGGAVRAFTLVLAANPIGLIAVAISTALVALYAFGDRIKITADGAVTLKDAFLTAWAYIKDAAGAVADFVRNVWGTAIDWLSAATDGWGEKFRNVGAVVVALAKMQANALIGSFVAGYKIIVGLWGNFPAAMESFFVAVVNFGATQVEALVNSWQIGLRAIADAAGGIAPELSKTLNANLDKMKIEIPRAQASKEAQNWASNLKGEIKEAFTTDYVGGAADAFMKRAREIAAERRKREQEADLRGKGANVTGGDPDGDKSAIKRALALEKVNKALDDELNRMFMLKPEREIQQKFDQIESDLLSKKIRLSAEEAAAIKNKIKTIEEQKYVQQEFDRIYEASIEPARTKNAVSEAANKLLAMGAISQRTYNQELLKANEAFKEATDPLFKYNREIEQNIELLKMLPREREIGQRLQQIQNDLLQKGIVLTQQETAALRAKLEVEKQLNDISQIQNAMYSESNANKAIGLSNSVTAAKGLVSNPASGVTAGDAVTSMAPGVTGLKDTTAYFETVQAGYANMYAAIEEMRQADLLSDKDAQLAKFSLFQEQSQTYLDHATGFLGNLSSLQNSENKKQAAIGKKAAIAQTIIQTYQSATGAFSSLASIPYVGPFLGAAAAAAAIAAGMANVQRIRSQGFMEGGYTGNMPTNMRAGDVHGQEFVMDAPATKRIGVANLEAMRRGMKPAATGSGKTVSTGGVSSGNDNRNGETIYNQTVQVTVAGKRDRRTAEHEARAIRRETVKEINRSGA